MPTPTLLIIVQIISHFSPTISKNPPTSKEISAISEQPNPCGQLYLTQSATKQKYLELNWHFSCKNIPDTILLTLNDIRKDPDKSKILYKITPGEILKGHHTTNFSIKNIDLPGNWTENNKNPDLKATCFDYYIASLLNGSLVYSQCLSIHPAWMSRFGDLSIGNLMIPGTHNSGAYRGVPHWIQDFVLNQDKNFWDQLLYGIRYFDIRVGRYGSPPEGFYINHAFVRCTPLVPELERVAKFIERSPKEVVILNFHRFPWPRRFKDNYHRELIELVKAIFKDSIFPFPGSRLVRHGPKLKEFWERGKRVIVSYRNDQVIKDFPWLWPPVKRDWGNIQDLPLLENYIKSKTAVAVRGNPMSVLMAELTPNYLYVLAHRHKNLQFLATEVNRELAEWMKTGNRARNLNIIATDFFDGNDIVNLAIETNFDKIKLS